MERAGLLFIEFFVMPFLMAGLILRVKAWWAGRKGAPLLQPVYDTLRLLRKGRVVSIATSWVFQVSPVLGLACLATALFLVPVAGRPALVHFPGDFVAFAYLLGLARFWGILGALDTASSFEGMGASREATFSALMEPGFFVVMGSLAALTGKASFTDLFGLLPPVAPGGGGDDPLAQILGYSVSWGHSGLLVPVVCANLVLFAMILVEACRVPVDDPTTHLELTMIHEVMILDNSGPDLALLQYGAALKMTVIGTLIAGIILPAGISLGLGLSLYVVLLSGMAVLVGCIESAMARLRMSHVPQFVLGGTAIGLLALAILLMGGRP